MTIARPIRSAGRLPLPASTLAHHVENSSIPSGTPSRYPEMIEQAKSRSKPPAIIAAKRVSSRKCRCALSSMRVGGVPSIARARMARYTDAAVMVLAFTGFRAIFDTTPNAFVLPHSLPGAEKYRIGLTSVNFVQPAANSQQPNRNRIAFMLLQLDKLTDGVGKFIE